MREGGVEPPRPHGHTDLNRARLPIPPLALTMARKAPATEISTAPRRRISCSESVFRPVNTDLTGSRASIPLVMRGTAALS